MSRETARTTTKSTMEVSATKCNKHSLNFVTGSSTPDSTRVLDIRCILKICYNYYEK